MLIKGKAKKKGLFFAPLFVAIAVCFMVGCVTTQQSQPPSQAAKPARVQAIKTSGFDGERTVVQIVNSKPAPFEASKLDDPLRVVLDIRGVPDDDLQQMVAVNDGVVRNVRVENGTTQNKTTRVVVELARGAEYETAEMDQMITLTLRPNRSVAAMAPETAYGKKAGGVAPKVYLKVGSADLAEVSGIDIKMLDRGKSQIRVTTDKKVHYNLERKGPKTLVLTVEGTTVSPQILRRLDGSQQGGAVDQVSPAFSLAENRLSIDILLKEMVPFHVDQTDRDIRVDFGPTSTRPAEKRPIPVAAMSAQPASASAGQSVIPGLTKTGKYRGPNMTMDFVNAEVTNVLRLIGEVSNLNIVWGPEVKGKVSMRLKNVPWEQALELILANNDLGKREEGNIIWVSTKSKIAQIEKEEQRKKEEVEAARRKKLEEAKELEKEAEKMQPVVTEYIPVDFADAEKDIMPHIDKLKTDRGSISVDSRTNTIIMTDIASVIEKAKDIVKEFDTPVKQIMIEARIVDASDSFIRDLGIQWNNLEAQRRRNTGISFGVPTDATAYAAGGDSLIGGNFSTNAPGNWVPNIGLTFGKLTSSMLGALTLDASLALSETEGKTKTISAPKVIAREGTSATISSGDSIIIPATENVASTTLDATLSLTVTPTAVSVNDFITLDVAVTDDQAPTNTRILKKSITTTLMVKSGETIVIGGIYRENEGYDEAGAPYLKDIPLLGWLFKSEERTASKSELLIFLTPTVMPPPSGKAL